MVGILVAVGISVGDTVVGMFVGLFVGDTEVGALVGGVVGDTGVGAAVGVFVGLDIGASVVGVLVGLFVGALVCVFVGLFVGDTVVGALVGVFVGDTMVGALVGVFVGDTVVGIFVGLFVGDTEVGALVGTLVAVGLFVGVSVGDTVVGALVGIFVGVAVVGVFVGGSCVGAHVDAFQTQRRTNPTNTQSTVMQSRAQQLLLGNGNTSMHCVTVSLTQLRVGAGVGTTQSGISVHIQPMIVKLAKGGKHATVVQGLSQHCLPPETSQRVPDTLTQSCVKTLTKRRHERTMYSLIKWVSLPNNMRIYKPKHK